MKLTRCNGILIHITSLPGKYGIGDLDSASDFIDYLAAAKQQHWQILPIGPTGYGDSPYQCLSSFAGNPMLIGLVSLRNDGLLQDEDLKRAEVGEGLVDFGKTIQHKTQALKTAFKQFESQKGQLSTEYQQFCTDNQHWLNDYALFSAIKRSHENQSWISWPPALRDREQTALDRFTSGHAAEIAYEKFLQYCFSKQWSTMHAYAQSQRVSIIGDLPIFVAHDSADVWSNRELFKLASDGQPTVVAGVPPDYFSATGQLWGNPIYTWDRHAADNYSWWKSRIAHLLNFVDVIRLDHFRGFIAHWEVPAGEDTAINGCWVDGPAANFFTALETHFGDLPIIAEDLGQITQSVEDVKNQFNLPGMVIFQFAFGTDANAPKFKPHNYIQNSVAYTGTHDNDTTVGWWQSTAGTGSVRDQAEIDAEIAYAKAYLDTDGSHIHHVFIKRLYASVANMVIIPMQDVLGLGAESRMNKPASAAGNWNWRLLPEELASLNERDFLANISDLYDRAPPALN